MRQRITVAVMLGLLLWTPPAFPCGGPAYYDLTAPLAPAESHLDRILWQKLGSEEATIRPEFLFLYPFRLARPAEVEDIWSLVYGSLAYVDPGDAAGDGAPSQPEAASGVDLARFEAAVRAGAFDAAEKEARAGAERVLDRPGTVYGGHHAEFRMAVEFIELRRFLKGVDRRLVEQYFTNTLSVPAAKLPFPLGEAQLVRDMNREDAEALATRSPSHPRIASIRFVALRETLRRDIPNGWQHEIQDKMTPEAWARLEQLHNDWLASYPDHPLADLVRASKVRLYYLQWDGPRAWRALLDMYPRHRPRVIADMRYLAAQGLLPDEAAVKRITDPVLLTALLSVIAVRPADWTAFWKLSEANVSKRWAVNLQERLLRRAPGVMKPAGRLPAGFPDKPLNPTPLWGKLRLVALLEAGELDEASEQAATLAPDVDTAPLRARLHLLRREWAKAVRVDGLDYGAKQYLIRVLAPEPVLVELSSDSDEAVRDSARLARAIRAAARGDWRAGADLLADVDPIRARLWQRAATLAADASQSGRLAWARFLAVQNGKLFYPLDSVWNRSLGGRAAWLDPKHDGKADPRLPWTLEDERQAVRTYLTTGTELFRTFEAYAAWLERAGPRDPRARAVLEEADQAYNRLVNWDSWRSTVWINLLEDTDAVVTVRRIGREIRAR